DPGDVVVVEEKDVERERQIDEKAVVRRRQVDELEEREEGERCEPSAPRAERREGDDELEAERGPALEVVPPRGHRVREPCEARRQRRGLVVEGHRAAVVPVVERRLPLREPRLGVELPEQNQKEDARPRLCALRGAAARAPVEEER